MTSRTKKQYEVNKAVSNSPGFAYMSSFACRLTVLRISFDRRKELIDDNIVNLCPVCIGLLKEFAIVKSLRRQTVRGFRTRA
jgi:hypothetical protein